MNQGLLRKKVKVRQFGKWMFLAVGVASLISWNAVLTAMDFFDKQFPGKQVAFWYPIPYFLSTNIFSFALIKLSQSISFETRMYGSMALMAVINIVLPVLSALSSPDNSEIIYPFSLICIFLLGMGNAVCQASGMAFATIFPKDNYVVLCISGTGLAGFLIAVIRIICLLIFDSESQTGLIVGTVVYFAVSSVLLLVIMVMLRSFTKTGYCRYHTRIAKQRSISNSIWDLVGSVIGGGRANEDEDKEKEEGEEDDEKEEEEEDDQINLSNYQISNPVTSSKEGYAMILMVMKKIWLHMFCVWLNFAIVFTVFPAVAIMKHLSGLNAAWGNTILIFIYNLGDTLGKMSTSKQFYNTVSATVVVIARLVFVALFVMIAYFQGDRSVAVISEDWFAYLNMALFALSTGFSTGSHMNLAPQKVSSELHKETAGFLMSFPLFFGISSGTLLALIFQNVQQW